MEMLPRKLHGAARVLGRWRAALWAKGARCAIVKIKNNKRKIKTPISNSELGSSGRCEHLLGRNHRVRQHTCKPTFRLFTIVGQKRVKKSKTVVSDLVFLTYHVSIEVKNEDFFHFVFDLGPK